MKLHTLLLLPALLALLLPAAATADERLALEAYRHQHFQLAYREFKAVAADSPVAQYHLGRMFERGEGVRANPQRAVRWYLKAVDQGHLDAHAALGELFTAGAGEALGKNYREARRWHSAAAALGHPQAAARLGEFYLNGRGGEKDQAKGLAWLMQSEKQGNDQAAMQLAALKKRLPAAAFEAAGRIETDLTNKGQGRDN